MKRRKGKREENVGWKEWMRIGRISRICLIIGWVGLGLILSGSLVYGQRTVSLRDWVELAFDTNPEYLLQYQDYQLARQGLTIQDQTGLEQVQLSLNPVTVSNEVLIAGPGVNFEISGDLPYQIQMEGSQSLKSDWKGNLDLSGNLAFSWNWQEYIQGQEREDVQWLELEQQFYQNRADLVQKVVTSYYHLILQQIRLEGTKKDVQLKEHEYDQRQIQYQAGRISKYDLMQSEMDLETARTQYEEEKRIHAKQRREFTWVFGEQGSKLEVGMDLESFLWTADQQVSQLVQILDVNELTFYQIEEFLQKWNPEELKVYLGQTYAYHLALENLRQQQEALHDVQKANQWKLSVGAGVNMNYNVIDKDPINYYGTVGLSKNLYQRQSKLQEKQAQLNLEREELAFAQIKERFVNELMSQMEHITYLEQQCQKQIQELIDWEVDFDRIEEQNQAGYLSDEELLKGEQLLLKKVFLYIESQLKLTQAKMKLGQTLCLPEFWQ